VTPSDIAAYASVIDKGGAIAVLVAVVVALSLALRWLLKLVFEAKDGAIAYRNEEIVALRAQLNRQQDLFDQAMAVLKDTAPRGRR
jgi:hypothetical protein